jgi:hypothetical protein
MSAEYWRNNFKILTEKYYEEFLDTHRKLEQGLIQHDEQILHQFHTWRNSYALERLGKEIKYRGWFKVE